MTSTREHVGILDLTREMRKATTSRNEREGVVRAFVEDSTAALSVSEFEPGAIRDLQQAMDRIAPTYAHYQNNEVWGAGNGYAHLRAPLTKPPLSIPILEDRLCLGTWQQAILPGFDNHPRTRTNHAQATDCV